MDETKWFKLKQSKKHFKVIEEQVGTVKVRFRYERHDETFSSDQLEKESDWVREKKEETKPALSNDTSPQHLYPFGYVGG